MRGIATKLLTLLLLVAPLSAQTVLDPTRGGMGYSNSVGIKMGSVAWDLSTFGGGIPKIAGGGSGALSQAGYADVVLLWASGSCSGFLKHDGTCAAGLVFTAAGDLGGNASSQTVIGFNGAALRTTDTVGDGKFWVYNAGASKFVLNTVSGLLGYTPANVQSCTNKFLQAVDAAGTAGNCQKVTSASVDTSIAQTGVDINTSFQVTALHLPTPTQCGSHNFATGNTSAGGSNCAQPVESDVTNLVSDLAAKASDSAVVHNTGTESIAGVKTFSTEVIVPAPSNSTDATTKTYVDTRLGILGGGDAVRYSSNGAVAKIYFSAAYSGNLWNTLAAACGDIADGDHIVAAGETFDAGSTCVQNSTTWCDLSKGGTITASLSGVGPQTVIKRSVTCSPVAPLISPGLSSSRVTDATVIDGETAGTGQTAPPIMNRLSSGTYYDVTDFGMERLNITGVSDGYIITPSTLSSGYIRDSSITAQWDLQTFNSTGGGGTVNFVIQNTVSKCTPDSGNKICTCFRALGSAGTANITLKGNNFCTITSSVSGATIKALTAENTGNNSFFIEPGALHIDSSGVSNAGVTNYDLNAPNNVNAIKFYGDAYYDVTKVNGASHISFASVLANTAITGVQGNGAKVQLSTGSLTSGNALKADANGNTVDAGYSATAIPLADLATQTADTMVANASGSTAAPAAVTLPPCASDGLHAWTYASHAINCTTIDTAVQGYHSPTYGSSGVAMAGGTINHIVGLGIFIPYRMTFSNIYFSIQTTDAANPVYGAGLIKTDGTAVCSTSSGVQLAATFATTAFPCSQGTVTVAPGQYILLMTGGSTTGKVNGLTTTIDVEPFSSTNITGCTATNGVFNFSSPCSISLSVAVPAIGMPNYLLY